MKKPTPRKFISWTSVFLSFLLIIAAILIAVNITQLFHLNEKYHDVSILHKEISALKNDITTDKLDSTILEEYYVLLDQKADVAIDKVVAIVSVLMTVVTLFGGLIAFKAPNDINKKIQELSDIIESIKRRDNETEISVKILEASTKKTTQEKITALTQCINESQFESSQIYFARGFLYDDVNDYEKAERDYKTAYKLGGSEYTFHNSMGVLYNNIFDTKKESLDTKKAKQLFEKAEKHYKKAITLLEEADIDSSYCLCNLACLYQDYAKYLKRSSNNDFQLYFENALNYFEEALNKDDSNAVAYYNRAISYEEWGHDYWSEAFSDYCKAIEINPEEKNYRISRATLAYRIYSETNDLKYYRYVKDDISNLQKEENRIETLITRLKNIEQPIIIPPLQSEIIDNLIFKINEKIGDLCVEEAQEYEIGSQQYKNCISEAKENYNEALEYLIEQQKISNNKDFENNINRIKEKLAKLDE